MDQMQQHVNFNHRAISLVSEDNMDGFRSFPEEALRRRTGFDWRLLPSLTLEQNSALTVEKLRNLTTHYDMEQVRVFKTLIQDCHEHIMERHAKRIQFCEYRVPAFRLDTVPYNRDDAIVCLTVALIQEGFDVELLPNTHLMITWCDNPFAMQTKYAGRQP